MTIETRETNVPLSMALREHVAHRVDASLRRFRGRVGRVRVWLEDVNGPRHGHDDKVCRIVAELEPHDRLVAEASSDDAYSAVGKAVAMLNGTVRRLVDRSHGRHHRTR